MTNTKNQTAAAWQPIETAPHDGRWHFVAHPAYGVPVVARRTGPGSEEFEWFFSVCEPEEERPTHWAPMMRMPA